MPVLQRLVIDDSEYSILHPITQTSTVETTYLLEQVRKAYERRGRSVTDLAHSTLTLGKGEFVAHVGSSGGGKTTLLSMLGSMFASSTGRILLDAYSLYDLSVQERTRIPLERIGSCFKPST